MISFLRVIAAWSIVSSTVAFAQGFRSSDADYVVPVSANEIKIMNYNVENLFDAHHDANKNDFEFLPKSSKEKTAGCNKESDANRRKYCLSTDWTDSKIEVKFGQIKKALEGQGTLPDILTVEEVENPAVIGRMAKYLGYDGFNMTNSPDVRGIDVATLYKTDKVKMIDFKEHELKNPIALTRNLSVTHFRLNNALGGGVLAIYPNHWPSQGTKTTKARLIPAEQLSKIIADNTLKYKNEDYHVVITGDFNTLSKESPNPVDEVLISAKSGLLDVATLSKAAGNPMHKKMPPATYYYGTDTSWNEFDRIIVSESLNDGAGLEVDEQSYRINAPSFLCKKNDAGESIPFRFNHNATNPAFLGFADHFGVVVKLKFN